MSDLPPQPFNQNPQPQIPSAGGMPGDAKAKLQIPAILMIVTGVLGLLIAAYYLLNGFVVMNTDIDAQLEMQRQLNPQFEEGIERLGMTPESYFAMIVNFCFVGSGISALTSLLCIFGGIKMRAAKSYGLVMIAAISCLLPCLQPCCVLGLPTGIWSLIVLMNADVKRLF